MGAKRVHVGVPKKKNSLSYKQRMLEFPKSSTSSLGNGFKSVTFYSSSPPFSSATTSSEHLLLVNSVPIVAGLHVTGSSVNAFVYTSEYGI